MVNQIKLVGALNAVLKKVKEIDIINRIKQIDKINQLTPVIDEDNLKVKIKNLISEPVPVAMADLLVDFPLVGTTGKSYNLTTPARGIYLYNYDPTEEMEVNINDLVYLVPPGGVLAGKFSEFSFINIITNGVYTGYTMIQEGTPGSSINTGGLD